MLTKLLYNTIASKYWNARKYTFLHSRTPLPSSKINENAAFITGAVRNHDGRLQALAEHQGSGRPSLHSNIPTTLTRWIRISRSFCKDCNSLLFQKLLLSFTTNKKCNEKNVCQCKDDKYIVPLVQYIPSELRNLQLSHILILRPFEIDLGEFCRMQHGYRKKNAMLRLQCSEASVQEKINSLSDQNDKEICQKAYNYLMSSLSSSYNKFIALRAQLIHDKEEPSIFAFYSWELIECALWPNLYPFTAWCESIHVGRESRKSSKISFITKCLSPIIDYSLNFEILQCV